jgi:hypothetical protein
MEFKNLGAIVDFAIEKEIEAAEFYTDLSKVPGRTKAPKNAGGL